MNPLEKPAGNQTAEPKNAVRQSMAALRLRKHADYQRAYAASRKRQSASMSWFLALQDPAADQAPLDQAAGDQAAQNQASLPRIGLTAGKVLGKAHERNRIKRRMREALRRHVDLVPGGCDLILHPRRSVLTMEFAKLEAEIVRILQQAKIEASRGEQKPALHAISTKPAS
jgi:ribonuclease P protein component